MNLILRITGLIGILLFGTGFVLTFSTPGFVEKIGQEFIKYKIKETTNEKIKSLNFTNSNNSLAKFAGKLLTKHENRILKLKEKLRSNAHIKLTEIMTDMRVLDCECRKKYERKLISNLQSSILSLQDAKKLLQDFMKMKYMEVANKLKTDFRTFTASNALVFLLLLLISFVKPKAITHLFLPAVLLVISTLVCSYFYIYEQNWFFTIIYNSYLGWSYLAFLSVVFGFLYDIVFNKARVTTELINGFLNSLGSALTVSPC